MDVYRKAMFRAYWIPLLVFFVLPSAFILGVSEGITMFEVAKTLLSFPLALFMSGYVLAPVLGPHVQSNKFVSFVMSFICLAVALAAYLAVLSVPDFIGLSLVFSLYVTLLLFGIFPAVLGGIFFIGACEREGT